MFVLIEEIDYFRDLEPVNFFQVSALTYDTAVHLSSPLVMLSCAPLAFSLAFCDQHFNRVKILVSAIRISMHRQYLLLFHQEAIGEGERYSPRLSGKIIGIANITTKYNW
jgi:hypothetical protein